MKHSISSLLGKVFQDREFLHYNGEKGMSVLKISARTQMSAAAVGVALLGSVTGLAATAGPDEALLQELVESRAEARAMRAKVATIENDVMMQTARMEQRQQFLASLFEGDASLDQLAAIMPKSGTAVVESASLMKPFQKLEQEQLAFVEQAATAAEARYRDKSASLRDLGLRPERFMRQSQAMGGPEIAADAQGGPLESAEPRFAQLFMSWKKLDLLEKELSAVPSFKPVKAYTYTSGYGVRFDPFKGTTAMHQGVDMAGPVGETIYAAAEGKVIRAGRTGGYGNMVEIDHGKGLTTRYAHMSRLGVKAGDRVTRGEEIGGMGSTGRSTGSHLHYEVRIDGKSVNPMPFLEAADFAANNSGTMTGIGGGDE
jgi:murein DD-endopeptidase MepM/ murein hydrolase activator NlpD|tara:strand:+ start:167431 stop:168546 length:1116 start_codon:yes stop_codon:yes gene_type:complete